jgi:hypothetical protein
VPAAIGLIKSDLIRPIACLARSRAPLRCPTFRPSANRASPLRPAVLVRSVRPAATPKDVMAKLVRRRRANRQGSGRDRRPREARRDSGEHDAAQFGDYVKADAARWGKVVADSGAKAD